MTGREGTGTPDGIIRNREVDRQSLPEGPWDGVNDAYIPSPVLQIHPSLQLHDEFDLDIDPITYQVLRSRFWNMNLDHSDTVKRVSGSSVIVYTEDFNTSLLTENGDTVLCGPSIQYFTGYGDTVVKWTLENRSANPGIEEGDIYREAQSHAAVAAGKRGQRPGRHLPDGGAPESHAVPAQPAAAQPDRGPARHQKPAGGTAGGAWSTRGQGRDAGA